jgi:hypothetical protein
MTKLEEIKAKAQRWNYIQENDLPNSCYFCKGLGFNCWSDPCPKSHFKVDDVYRIKRLQEMENKHNELLKKLGLHDDGESLW